MKARRFAVLVVVAGRLVLACHRDSGPAGGNECGVDGVVSSRVLERPGQAELAVEIVQSCGDCQQKRRAGAPEGSPCSAPSVCSELCCECSKSQQNTFRARVCDAGKCGGAAACELARAAIRPDVCAP